MADSIRLRILQGLRTHFLAMNAAAGYVTDWEDVKHTPLTSNDRKKKAVLRIWPGTETKEIRVLLGQKGQYDSSMVIDLEWYYLFDAAVEAGGDALVMAETVLKEVQMWVDLANHGSNPLHNLALSILEIDNSTDVDDESDIQLEGTLTVVCKYKHKQGDPTVAK